MTNISVIILVGQEKLHIRRCLERLAGLKPSCVYLVTSLPDDGTVALARETAAAVGLKVEFLHHDWPGNQAAQFNWALDEIVGSGQCVVGSWVLRLDADEYLTTSLAGAIEELVKSDKLKIKNLEDTVNGIYVRKRIDYLGRPLLHGGWYPQYHLKVFRRGHGACENRWMDEHITLTDGTTTTINIKGADQVDANLNDLTWWTEKHNSYATREMVDMLMIEYGMDDEANEITPRFFGSGPERKRWLNKSSVSSCRRRNRDISSPMILQLLNHHYFFLKKLYLQCYLFQAPCA